LLYPPRKAIQNFIVTNLRTLINNNFRNTQHSLNVHDLKLTISQATLKLDACIDDVCTING